MPAQPSAEGRVRATEHQLAFQPNRRSHTEPSQTRYTAPRRTGRLGPQLSAADEGCPSGGLQRPARAAPGASPVRDRSRDRSRRRAGAAGGADSRSPALLVPPAPREAPKAPARNADGSPLSRRSPANQSAPCLHPAPRHSARLPGRSLALLQGQPGPQARSPGTSGEAASAALTRLLSDCRASLGGEKGNEGINPQ